MLTSLHKLFSSIQFRLHHTSEVRPIYHATVKRTCEHVYMYNDRVNHQYAWRKQQRHGRWKSFAILLWPCRCIEGSQVATCGSHGYCFEGSRGWQYSATASCSLRTSYRRTEWNAHRCAVHVRRRRKIRDTELKPARNLLPPIYSHKAERVNPLTTWTIFSDGPTFHLIEMTKLLVC